MLISLLRLILLLWIISVVVKWFRRNYLNKPRETKTENFKSYDNSQSYDNSVNTGKIVDAEFEEIDGSEKK